MDTPTQQRFQQCTMRTGMTTASSKSPGQFLFASLQCTSWLAQGQGFQWLPMYRFASDEYVGDLNIFVFRMFMTAGYQLLDISSRCDLSSSGLLTAKPCHAVRPRSALCQLRRLSNVTERPQMQLVLVQLLVQKVPQESFPGMRFNSS